MKSTASWVVCYGGRRFTLRVHIVNVILLNGTAVFARFFKTKINFSRRYGGSTSPKHMFFVNSFILSFQKRPKITVPSRFLQFFCPKILQKPPYLQPLFVFCLPKTSKNHRAVTVLAIFLTKKPSKTLVPPCGNAFFLSKIVKKPPCPYGSCNFFVQKTLKNHRTYSHFFLFFLQ